MNIGTQILKIRKEKALTQEEFGKIFHVTRQTVSNWENEKSYPDLQILIDIKCRSGSHGVYTSKVEDLHEDYLRPQENGSHTDCDYVCVSNDKMTLSAAGKKTIAFNASEYTQEELTNKKLGYELEKCGSTVLCIDYSQNGIGSNSCGPVLSEKYQLKEEKFTFDVKLVLHNR